MDIAEIAGEKACSRFAQPPFRSSHKAARRGVRRELRVSEHYEAQFRQQRSHLGRPRTRISVMPR